MFLTPNNPLYIFNEKEYEECRKNGILDIFKLDINIKDKVKVSFIIGHLFRSVFDFLPFKIKQKINNIKKAQHYFLKKGYLNKFEKTFIFEIGNKKFNISNIDGFMKLDENIFPVHCYLLAKKWGDAKKDVLSAIAIYYPSIDKEYEKYKKINNNNTVNIGIPGLSSILFPNEDNQNGFVLPNNKNNVPRIIIIKGAPGTGKTTLAVQMLLRMVQDGFKCSYWCTNDDPKSIQFTAKSYKFIDDNNTIKFNSKNNNLGFLNIEIPVIPLDRKYRKEKNPITMVSIKKLLKFMKKGLKRYLKKNEIIFLDSFNVSMLMNKDRITIKKIFQIFRKYNVLTFILLEDYLEKGTDNTRQLIADCEFLSDLVLELGDDINETYHTKYLRIIKKHFGTQIYGKHFYKICPPYHSLTNVEGMSGIIVHPSIHKYLTGARKDTFSMSNDNFVNSGITHLDSILVHEDTINGNSIAPNASIVIQGEKGGYKFPVAMNVLLGGLWINNKEYKNGIEAERDVLVILLNEDHNIDLNQIAIASHTHFFTDKSIDYNIKSMDNGQWIKWRKHIGRIKKDDLKNIKFSKNINDQEKNEIIDKIYNYLIDNNYLDESTKNINKPPDDNFLNKEDLIGYKDSVIEILYNTYQGIGHKYLKNNEKIENEFSMQCQLSRIFNLGSNYKQKIIFNKWCAYIPSYKDKRLTCRKLIVANFRPGCITPEEFISSIKNLLEEGNFSRVLFNSTALIPMRFPLLADDKLFIPALIDLFKSKNVVSIFVDPQGDGAKKDLSFSLSNLADYLINIEDDDSINSLYEFDYTILDNKIKNIKNKIEKERLKNIRNSLKNNIDKCRWSIMTIRNIRGKKYSSFPHAVTVRSLRKKDFTFFDIMTELKNVDWAEKDEILEILIKYNIIDETIIDLNKIYINAPANQKSLTEKINFKKNNESGSEILMNQILKFIEVLGNECKINIDEQNKLIKFFKNNEYIKKIFINKIINETYNELFIIDLKQKI